MTTDLLDGSPTPEDSEQRSGMSEDDFRRSLEHEVSNAQEWADSNIRAEQARNLRMYLGLPLGNEVPGRSQLLSLDVFEVVESALPDLIEPFFSGDNIGEFAPRQPGDEAYSEQATEAVNYVIRDQNPGFQIFMTWLKDGLMQKIGITRTEWRQPDPKRIERANLTDEQFAQLMQGEETGAIELVEHSERPDETMAQQIAQQMANVTQKFQEAMAQYQQAAQQAQAQGRPVPPAPQPPPPAPPPPMLHDVTYLQTQDGCVDISNVRPENFIHSRGASSLDHARLVGEHIVFTRSDLVEMGFDPRKVADLSDFGNEGDDDEITELREGDDDPLKLGTGSDPSMEEVELFRGFIRADYNGDGVAEYRYVLAGGNAILVNDEAEWQDYATWSPIPLPHRVVGMAYADPATEVQRFKTTLTRQYADSLYAANNPRTYVNLDAQVNLDDLVSTRINGLVRGRGPAANAVTPLVTTLVSKDALEGLQYADTMREGRIGITRYNQGLDSESLNKTAAGSKMIMSAANRRILMTLRVFAENGVKQLFRLVLKTLTKYQDRPALMRLRDQFVPYDPRNWNPDMDAMVDVGLGSGDKTETLLMLQQFGQYMAWAQTMGVVNPMNVYEFGKMMAKNGKLKGAEQKLLTDPSKQPPAPPQPTPEQVKAQAEAQRVQFETQAKAAEGEKERAHQASMAKMQAELQARVDQHAQQVQAAQNDREQQIRAQIEGLKIQAQERQADADRQFEVWKVQQQEETKRHIAEIGRQQARESALMGAHENERDRGFQAQQSAQKDNDGS